MPVILSCCGRAYWRHVGEGLVYSRLIRTPLFSGPINFRSDLSGARSAWLFNRGNEIDVIPTRVRQVEEFLFEGRDQSRTMASGQTSAHAGSDCCNLVALSRSFVVRRNDRTLFFGEFCSTRERTGVDASRFSFLHHAQRIQVAHNRITFGEVLRLLPCFSFVVRFFAPVAEQVEQVLPPALTFADAFACPVFDRFSGVVAGIANSLHKFAGSVFRSSLQFSDFRGYFNELRFDPNEFWVNCESGLVTRCFFSLLLFLFILFRFTCFEQVLVDLFFVSASGQDVG